ncbi:MAG: Zn-finger nucleic acid-binding protein [Candidatus Krumholzibacteriia bacterium]
MKCPVCQVPTYVVEHQEIELDLCPECQGVWFDNGELELLLDRDRAAPLVAAKTDEELRKCPLCTKKMNKVNIGPAIGVLVDSCPDACGVWFDDQELTALTRDLAAEGWQIQPKIRQFLHEMFPSKGV